MGQLSHTRHRGQELDYCTHGAHCRTRQWRHVADVRKDDWYTGAGDAKIYSEADSPQGENFHIAKFPEQDATMRQTLKDATKYYRLTFVEKQPTLIMETDISDIKMLPNTTSVKQQPTL